MYYDGFNMVRLVIVYCPSSVGSFNQLCRKLSWVYFKKNIWVSKTWSEF